MDELKIWFFGILIFWASVVACICGGLLGLKIVMMFFHWIF